MPSGCHHRVLSRLSFRLYVMMILGFGDCDGGDDNGDNGDYGDNGDESYSIHLWAAYTPPPIYRRW